MLKSLKYTWFVRYMVFVDGFSQLLSIGAYLDSMCECGLHNLWFVDISSVILLFIVLMYIVHWCI